MDPKEVQQKAIPLKVIALIERVRATEIQRATATHHRCLFIRNSKEWKKIQHHHSVENE